MNWEFGIDALGVALPRAYLALEDLAVARGVPPAKYTGGLGTREMAVPAPEDDAVSLAARAAADALERGGVDPAEIGLCIVGTESAVDHSKPVSSFVQGLVGLPRACRVFETKHACYGGTAGLMTALDWLAAGRARGKKALVVCADVARYGLGTPGEPTQGAGAVALVVSERPRVLAIDASTVGTSSRDVHDFWRPLDRHDALVDGHYSVECYLTALREAYVEHARLRGGADDARDVGAMVFHVPYGKMAHKAFAALCAAGAVPGAARVDAAGAGAGDDAAFARLVAPSLVVPSRVGNVYTASLYLALASLLACAEGAHPAGAGATPLDGRDVALFSYGSGCCAEYFRGRVVPGASRGMGALLARLDDRARLTVAEYEALFHAHGAPREAPAPSAAPAPRAPSARAARFLGTRDGKRVYA